MKIRELIKRTGIHCLVQDEDGKILVLKRHEDDYKDAGFWDLPGGGLDKGEDVTGGLKREVTEETGLEITEINLIGSYTCDEGRLQLCATAFSDSNKVTVSHEHSRYSWIDINKLIELKPAGLHLKAAQYFLTHDQKLICLDDLNQDEPKPKALTN